MSQSILETYPVRNRDNSTVFEAGVQDLTDDGVSLGI